jgi:hypothetical protein
MTDTTVQRSENHEQPEQATGPIVATAGRYYRNMRYLMFVLFLGFGAWFGYDGWIGWPKMNDQIRKLTAERQALPPSDPRSKQLFDELQKLNNGELRNDWSIFLQKFLCVTLPLLGTFVLIRALYRSRGEVRLEGQTLSVPGHPPIPFENITEVDRRLWQKKGIAYVHYDLGDGRQGRALLDDFLYEQTPIDAIYKRVEAFVDPEDARDDKESSSEQVNAESPSQSSSQQGTG